MDWIKVGIGALVGGAVAAVITSLLVIYFDKPAASSGGGTDVASGAVMAFDGVSSCPSGWSLYTKAASRVIVGAATSSPGKGADGQALSAHKAGTSGGQESVTLAAANLPPHTHQYEDIFYSENGGTVSVPNNEGSKGSDNDNKGYQMTRTTMTDKTSPAAIPVLPPFIALTYCVKS